MAKPRKKKRTHVQLAEGTTASGKRIPRSMVVRMGGTDVGHSVSQLAMDFRAVMEPHTASRLKVRSYNSTMRVAY